MVCFLRPRIKPKDKRGWRLVQHVQPVIAAVRPPETPPQNSSLELSPSRSAIIPDA